MDGGKFKRKLSEINTRAVSRRQNELVGKFKMAAGDKESKSTPDLTNSLLIPVGMYVYSITCPLINCCHLVLAYQFVLSSRYSLDINLK